MAFPITAHRDEEFAELFKATARRVVAPYNSGDAVPATMPWVGIVAQKAPPFQYSRTESNKTTTATPKPPPAQGAKREEQK